MFSFGSDPIKKGNIILERKREKLIPFPLNNFVASRVNNTCISVFSSLLLFYTISGEIIINEILYIVSRLFNHYRNIYFIAPVLIPRKSVRIHGIRGERKRGLKGKAARFEKYR